MIIGTAGHVDHGKTALIKALTGVDADRLKEEKTRGISIDLGYAYWPLPDGNVIGFVDMPGHKRFMHNLLTGVSGIDYVLLVVAADDGLMPQTYEHLEILDLLNIQNGAVVITKTDRVTADRLDSVKNDVQRVCQDTTLQGCPVFPVCCISGSGIKAIQKHLEHAVANTPIHKSHGAFRLAIDRVFTLAGAGTIATGTVYSGKVSVGDQLVLSACGQKLRVRGIHAQNRQSGEGRTGQRCAINLAGVDKAQIKRGDWLLAEELNHPSTRIDTRFIACNSVQATLKHWMPARLYIGTAREMVHLSLLDKTSFMPGDTGYVQLVVDRPVYAAHGDRFIIRDQSGQQTLGGGYVLDAFAPSRKIRKPQRLAILSALDNPDTNNAIQNLFMTADAGVELDWLKNNFNFPGKDIKTLCAKPSIATLNTANNKQIAIAGDHLIRIRKKIIDSLTVKHNQSPEKPGIESHWLRRIAVPELGLNVLSAITEQMQQEKMLSRNGPWLHLPGHRIRLTAAETKLWNKVSILLKNNPFQPPWVRDISHTLNLPETMVRMLLKRVSHTGDTYEIVRDRFFTKEAITKLADIIDDINSEQGEIKAAMFRDRIGCGRKLAIQILEYFDHTGFLHRTGDVHHLRDTTSLLTANNC